METRVTDLEKIVVRLEEKTTKNAKEIVVLKEKAAKDSEERAVLKERIGNIIQSQKETKNILFGVLGSVGMVLVIQIMQISLKG